MTALCPCGSGTPYSECCGPLHAGAAAHTAETLMRSRFSAFALGLDRYLLASWHPSNRPPTIELEPGRIWRKLQIVDTAPGVVEFRASFRSPRGGGLVYERSRFVHEHGTWFYVDGDDLGG